MCKHDQTRRQFLRTASFASMAGISASPFLMGLNSMAAMAQSSTPTDYKALVCVFLQGGNDGHGTVIATDADSYAAFTAARSGAPGLAYPLSDLLPITLKTPQTGRTFALNPGFDGRAEPVQRRPRGHRRQHRHADRSRDQGAGAGQLRAAA